MAEHGQHHRQRQGSKGGNEREADEYAGLPMPIKLAMQFLRGELPLTDQVLVGLHKSLVNPALVRRLVEASKRSAMLGQRIGDTLHSLQEIIKHPAFDWGGAEAERHPGQKPETHADQAHEAAAAAVPATADAHGLSDSVTTTHKTMLHAEEIFADVPTNNVHKNHAFNDYNRALNAVAPAEKAVRDAKSEKARAAAEAKLAKAKEKVASTLSGLKGYIVEHQYENDKVVRLAKQQLKKANAATAAEIRKQLANRRAEIEAEVESMKHHDPGHDESVFEPIDTEVHTHHVKFDDGQTVVMHDHVESYATTSGGGLDTGEGGAAGKAQVRDKMDHSGLSSSRAKILKEVSGFEGSFDTTQSYDRADLTWGFVQWTRGSHSDLTKTLAIIKEQHPKAFADQFQTYGLDVVKDQLVYTPAGGKQLVGEPAAKAIATDPKLLAVMAHAGRSEEIQQGEVQAAEKVEISSMLAKATHVKEVTVHWSRVLTSEYAVGLLANITVHAGSGTAQACMKAAIQEVLEKNVFADDEQWYAAAEKAAIVHFVKVDAGRAAALGKKLEKTRGSFK